MLMNIGKVLALLSALFINMIIATLCWLRLYSFPLFLVSIVVNLAAGIVLGHKEL